MKKLEKLIQSTFGVKYWKCANCKYPYASVSKPSAGKVFGDHFLCDGYWYEITFEEYNKLKDG